MPNEAQSEWVNWVCGTGMNDTGTSAVLERHRKKASQGPKPLNGKLRTTELHIQLTGKRQNWGKNWAKAANVHSRGCRGSERTRTPPTFPIFARTSGKKRRVCSHNWSFFTDRLWSHDVQAASYWYALYGSNPHIVCLAFRRVDLRASPSCLGAHHYHA